MLQVLSGLKGFSIDAPDGRLGAVVDFLFDDSTWRVRWLVVECGAWLKSRKVLIHPSAISTTHLEEQRFDVNLTMAQIDASPDWSEDRPVSRQMEDQLYRHYGWNPLWGAPYLAVSGAMASPLLGPSYFGLHMSESASSDPVTRVEHDQHLRSFEELVGYRVHASDGDIGHVENLMLDFIDWSLPYLIVDTKNWWFGEHVLISVAAVNAIEWTDRHIRLDVSRDQVRTSPKWDPLVAFNEVYAHHLHRHYGWPGSGA